MKDRGTRLAPGVALAAVALLAASAGCDDEVYEAEPRSEDVAALDAEPGDEVEGEPAGAMDAARVEPATADTTADARDAAGAPGREGRAAATDETLEATAALESRDGEAVGEVRLTQTPNGLIVEASFTGLPQGTHAFHIHEKGECDPDTSFESAGGHFAPRDQGHGFLSENGRHAGDLPNVEIPESSRLDVTHFLPEVTLEEGELALMDDDGAAFVVHQGADDYRSDPAGNAGPRVACGVVEAEGAGTRLSLR